MEPVAHYTHIQNTRGENAIRVAKEHVRYLLWASNFPKIFCPFVLLHFLRIRAYWPSDPHNRSVWERLDTISPDHKMRHDITKDLHISGSHVKGHLPCTHPLVDDIRRSTPSPTLDILIPFCPCCSRVMLVIK